MSIYKRKIYIFGLLLFLSVLTTDIIENIHVNYSSYSERWNLNINLIRGLNKIGLRSGSKLYTYVHTLYTNDSENHNIVKA